MIRDPVGLATSFYEWVWRDVFSREELDVILEMLEGDELEPGLLSRDNTVPNTDIRVTDIKMHHLNDENSWIFDRLDSAIHWANDNYYNFDLTGYNFFQYGVYDSAKGGHYGLHSDCFWGGKSVVNGLQRKLSMTVLLDDDYEGGEFVLQNGRRETIETVPGRAIMFPSFMIHGVERVTKGCRKSLVVWVLGPQWR